MADRRDATNREAGQVVGFAGSRAANIRFAGHRSEAGDVHAIRTGDKTDDRLEFPTGLRCYEDKRLDDLADLHAQRICRVLGRVRRAVEDPDLERDALAGRRVEDALDRGVGRRGHGPESITGDSGQTVCHPFLRSRSEVGGGAPRRHPPEDYDPDVKAFVFDWDGTLVDTLGQIFRANRDVLGRLGLPFDEALYREHYNPDWRLMYQRLGVPIDKLEEAGERWLEAFDPEHFGEPFPGAVDALRGLRAAGHPLGLVTAGDRSIVTRQLEKSGLGEVLTARVFGDDLPVHKPDPRPLQLVLSELGFADPADSAYVGDAPDDMRMACAVGTEAIGIASIIGQPDELKAAGATSVHASVAEWADTILAASPSAVMAEPRERATR